MSRIAARRPHHPAWKVKESLFAKQSRGVLDYFLMTTHIPWTSPGMYPHKVNPIFSQKCMVMPTWRKTATGGIRMAMMIRTARGMEEAAGVLDMELDLK
jgi:hypothetical protein